MFLEIKQWPNASVIGHSWNTSAGVSSGQTHQPMLLAGGWASCHPSVAPFRRLTKEEELHEAHDKNKPFWLIDPHRPLWTLTTGKLRLLRLRLSRPSHLSPSCYRRWSPKEDNE